MNFKKWLVNSCLMTGGICIGIGIIEVIAISTGFLIPQDFKDRHRLFYEVMEPDQKLGYKAKPYLKNLKHSWMEDAVSEVINTDKYGFRNPERDYAKTELYFVGDSFTWGVWVNREKTFYGIIESKLKTPVVNLSVGGYDIQQYQTLFENFIIKYKPKVVVLGIFANDLTPLLPASSFENYYENMGWIQYKSLRWYQKTFLYQVLYKKLFSGEYWNNKSHNGEAKIASNGIVFYQYRGASNRYFKDSIYKDTENILLKIIELSKSSNTKLILALFPSKESTYLDDYKILFPSTANYIESNEEFAYKRFCQIAKNKNVSCLNLTQSFRQRGTREKLYFERDPHWNTAGHLLAASELEKTLRTTMSAKSIE